MSSSFIDYFDTNINILKWAGVWIPEKNAPQSVRIWYYIYNSFWIFYSVIIFTPSEFIVLNTTIKSLNDLMKNLNMSMTHFLATIKVIIWFRKRNAIINIIEVLRNASAAYEPINDFQPDEITKIDKKRKNITTVAFLIVASCVSLTACLNSFITLFATPKEEYMIFNNITNETTYFYSLKLPYFSFIPWNYTEAKWKFAAAIVFQFFPVFNFAFIIVGFDTLFIAIISYTTAQLSILQGAFKTIRPRCLRRLNMDDKPVLYDPSNLADEMMKELNRCIKHLQTIFNVCEKVESIFTYVTLAQVLISLIVFCTCLYLVSSFPFASGTFGSEFVYLVAIETQLALYCYFGNQLTLEGENISHSLYEGDWFSATKSFKTSMIITMTRMKRPILVTIGKFSPLTLSTLVTITRASYSFFAVLKNSKQNNLDTFN